MVISLSEHTDGCSLTTQVRAIGVVNGAEMAAGGGKERIPSLLVSLEHREAFLLKDDAVRAPPVIRNLPWSMSSWWAMLICSINSQMDRTLSTSRVAEGRASSSEALQRGLDCDKGFEDSPAACAQL